MPCKGTSGLSTACCGQASRRCRIGAPALLQPAMRSSEGCAILSLVLMRILGWVHQLPQQGQCP